MVGSKEAGDVMIDCSCNEDYDRCKFLMWLHHAPHFHICVAVYVSYCSAFGREGSLVIWRCQKAARCRCDEGGLSCVVFRSCHIFGVTLDTVSNSN